MKLFMDMTDEQWMREFVLIDILKLVTRVLTKKQCVFLDLVVHQKLKK